ncbi:phosphate acetyltransferase [Marinigracilibium pacificum]|uniref:Phosphate acetyltransferase n=1 Tax=Marinigracilibium pacificum TaxID=2729599 RepID=A0A848IZQ1_9BACT|nr:phosphate acetyltransferase [Marinigracilibium pacificum]NMM50023.1 phosphate acetyltransferase [Marinigracilibium pacificum]
MAGSIYLTTSESGCGKSLVLLGISEILLRKTNKIGIFRPFISRRGEIRDKNIELILKHFNLQLNYEDTYAFYLDEGLRLIQEGKKDWVIEKVIEKFKAIEEKCDFVICEGSDFSVDSVSFEFDINATLAKNLGCPVMVVGKGTGRNLEETLNPLFLAYDSFINKGCRVMGVIINKVSDQNLQPLLDTLNNRIPDESIIKAVIPNNRILESPTLREIAEQLNAEVLYGEERLENQAYNITTAAMQVQNVLPRLVENSLVITPGDRADVILGVLQAHASVNYPPLAGILLSTGFKPDHAIDNLLRGISQIIPILSVKTNTYETVSNYNKIHSYITHDNALKIKTSMSIFEKYIDTDKLEKELSDIRSEGLTPKMFEYQLTQKAKSQRKRIVLPEGDDPRVLKAAAILSERDIVDLILVGDEDELRQKANKLSISLDFNKVLVTNPKINSKTPQYINKIVELRQHKGVNHDMAKDLINDVSYFATMMVLEGDADGMVSGAVHTTQHTIRPALQLIKTKPEYNVVSSVFFMSLADRVLVYGDCAVNPNPNAEELAEIAIASAETSRNFGIEPKVAMLSYSSGDSGKGEEVEKVRKATEIVKSKVPDLAIDGPIQYDAAVDTSVGAKKLPGSPVAGKATVLIFPDLNTGNNTYKAVQRETGAIAIGPVLQGLNKPVNDLSRGCKVDDIVNTVIITAIQSQDYK